MKRKTGRLTMTITLEVPNDPEPGHPTRLVAAFKRIEKLLKDGATSGEFSERFEYSQGGSPETDIAQIRYEVTRS